MTDPGTAYNGARVFNPNGEGRGHDGGEPEAPQQPLPVIRGSDFAGRPVPRRKWLCEGLIPSRNVTLFGGDGGTGKSLLALQLAVACATRRDWIGRTVRAGPALYLSAEDDTGELHRRLRAILDAEGLGFEALGDLALLSLADEDPLLASFNRMSGRMLPTPLFVGLEAKAATLRPAVLILDTAADLFGGDEASRAQVRQFLNMLSRLALRYDTTVVLLAHPSVTGLSTGSGLSGSTAWSNSVRSRLYLSRIVNQGFEPNPNARTLRLMKANYAAAGSEIRLTWRNGVFVADAPACGLDRMAATEKAQRVFLKLLRQFTEEGRNVNHAGGVSYAPKLFAEHPGAEGVTKRAFTTAMNALLGDGRIRIEEHGPPSKRRARLVEA